MFTVQHEYRFVEHVLFTVQLQYLAHTSGDSNLFFFVFLLVSSGVVAILVSPDEVVDFVFAIVKIAVVFSESGLGPDKESKLFCRMTDFRNFQ